MSLADPTFKLNVDPATTDKLAADWNAYLDLLVADPGCSPSALANIAYSSTQKILDQPSGVRPSVAEASGGLPDLGAVSDQAVSRRRANQARYRQRRKVGL